MSKTAKTKTAKTAKTKTAKTAKTNNAKAKKRFCVRLHYHSCVDIDIEAESMEDAERKATFELEPTNDEILENLVYAGRDIEEMKDTVKYTVTDIDWDTSDYGSSDPCDANVPDLPKEVLVVSEGEADTERIGDALSGYADFAVSGFSCEETPDADPCEFTHVVYI